MRSIQDILKSSKIIAMVGLSANESKASNQVATYLKAEGYTIIPINPKETCILGETSYPGLAEVPQKIDVVDIFRKSEDVPPIVDEAVRVGAKVVWMQEGVVNEEAASKARDAGLDVVMDHCMLKEYKRMMGISE